MHKYEIENIKKAHADIMRNHTLSEALKYSNYSEVPSWLNITNIKFMIIKRTEDLFKLTQERETILKKECIDMPFMVIENMSKAELSLHLDLMRTFGQSLRNAFEDIKVREDIMAEKETLKKAIDNGITKKPMPRI